MYITINNQTYADVRMSRLRNGDVLFTGESLDMTEVSGEIITYRDDGFELRRDEVSDYLRAEIGQWSILLTNTPEPEPEPLTPKQLREIVYETEAIIEYDGDTLTVDEANEMWKRYSAEGNTEKAEELTALISQAKASIRERYPD